MLKCKTTPHIRTQRNVKGFRHCRVNTGVPLTFLAEQTDAAALVQLRRRELRRQWLVARWNAHATNVQRTR